MSAATTYTFHLSKLIAHQGYDCIVEAIFVNMDPITLAKCRLVSKQWKNLIDNRKSILAHQLQQLKQNKMEIPDDSKVWYKLRRIFQSQRNYSICEQFPEFRQVFLDLERNATVHELRSIVVVLKKYSKHQRFPTFPSIKMDKKISPLQQAIKNGNQEFVRILMKRTKLYFQSPIPDLAMHNQSMVQLFLNYAFEKGINFNVPDEQGRTAFHYACMFGTLEVVLLLWTLL